MESLHFFLMIVIISIIVCLQLYFFLKNYRLISNFKNIFPKSSKDEWIINRNGDIQILSKTEHEQLERQNQLKNNLETLIQNESVLKEKQEHLEQLVATTHPDEDGNYELSYFARKDKIKELKKERKQIATEISNIQTTLTQIQTETRIAKTFYEDKSATRNTIISSINSYLIKNKDSVTDFNLIKDIVDRNCDAKEEEIQTQNPIPLYLGLVGTMAGIIVGVLVLLASGALRNMMTTFDPTLVDVSGLSEDAKNAAIETARKLYEAKATAGVQALLEGVGIAMASSILGIILTTIGSLLTKDAKVEIESNKHDFLSWMQAELLPKISTDVSAALVKLGKDLNGFNSTFSSNAKLLQDTIQSVTSATTKQTELLNAIQRLDVARVAEANISIYENLKNCSVELRSLGNNMQHIKTGIKEVSEELDAQLSEYTERESYIKDASSKVDIATGKAQKQLASAIEKSFSKYKELIDNLYLESEKYTKASSENYKKEVDTIHQAIVTRLGDLKKMEDELKNLSSVRENIASLEKTTARQAEKMDRLASSISELAKVKAGIQTSSMSDSLENEDLPKWAKIIIWSFGISTWIWFIVWTVLSVISVKS